MANQVKRAEQKVRAIRQAEWRLKQRLETIDWQHDVLLPEIEELRAGAAMGQLPDITLAD